MGLCYLDNSLILKILFLQKEFDQFFFFGYWTKDNKIHFADENVIIFQSDKVLKQKMSMIEFFCCLSLNYCKNQNYSNKKKRDKRQRFDR